MLYSFTGDPPRLPVDPSLEPGSKDNPSLPSLLSGAKLGAMDSGESTSSLSPSVVVAEGMPPIASKLLDRIRRWEFIDLALLLNEAGQKSDEIPHSHDGRVVLVQSVEQAQHRRKQIGDIYAWTQAFAVYMAALASASTTTMEEVVGLIAHLHLVTQLSKDLSGGRWLHYDHDFWEWAAAKGVRIWGELNLTIYGWCLSAQGQAGPSRSSATSPPAQRPRRPVEKRGRSFRESTRKWGACFCWNFEGGCERVDCHFSHSCYHCGDHHQANECSRAPKFPRQLGNNDL